MEARIQSLSALSILSSYTIIKETKSYSLNDNARDVANKIREVFYPKGKKKNDRDFLKELIRLFAKQNIFVFEFIEQHNVLNKTSLNGVFISPHYIILKRQQLSFKREIFTLAHELGHYLLQKEEIDQILFENKKLNEVESWCNKFASYFLIGEKLDILEGLDFSDKDAVMKFSSEFHISRLALLTHLAVNSKISWEDYKKAKTDIDEEYKKDQERKKQKKQEDKENGIKQGGASSKPIFSPLEKSIYSNAYFEGVIGEYELLSHFKTKDLDKVLNHE